MSDGADPALGARESLPGWCAREVEEELPGLRLLVGEASHTRAQALTGASPADVRGRLRELSNRFRGARAVGMRREPVPGAYRVFFRQIGLDPDAVRTPIEAAVMERMLRGGFLTGGLLEDVLLIALLDTGVPVWALDAESVDGQLGIRASDEGEPLGRSAQAPPLPARPFGRRRRLGGARDPLRRAGAGARAARPDAARDAVRRAGRRGADAVRGGVAVGLPRGARAVLSALAKRVIVRPRAGRLAALPERRRV